VIYGGFIPRNLQESYVVGYWEITRSTNFYTYKRWDCWEPIWCALGKKIGTVLLQKFKQKFGFE
jgi:hypothetical protein